LTSIINLEDHAPEKRCPFRTHECHICQERRTGASKSSRRKKKEEGDERIFMHVPDGKKFFGML